MEQKTIVKQKYTPPEVTVVKIAIERGFEASMVLGFEGRQQDGGILSSLFESRNYDNGFGSGIETRGYDNGFGSGFEGRGSDAFGGGFEGRSGDSYGGSFEGRAWDSD